MSVPPEALLAGYPEPIIDLAEGLRALVGQAIPARIEAVRPGWRLIGYDLPVGRRTTFFAWIMPEAVHVHLGFPHGVLLDDPAGLLGGVGETKRARWLTLAAGDQIPVAQYTGFILAAARLAGLSASERDAFRFDREVRGLPVDPKDSKSKPR